MRLPEFTARRGSGGRLAPLSEMYDVVGDCWFWRGKPDKHGYGQAHGTSAHRLYYMVLVGPIPGGLVLDHLCRQPRCVNPAHLEAVTQGENVRRGNAGENVRAVQRAKTECPKGHPYGQGNTLVIKGKRRCKSCGAAYLREWRKRRSA